MAYPLSPEESYIVMTDLSLPEPAPMAWQDKPIATHDARQGRQSGLLAFLDRVRQQPYVTAIDTRDFYPRLVVETGFSGIPGEPAALEGWFAVHDEQTTTRFRVTTTARTEAEQQAVLRDLRQRLLER